MEAILNQQRALITELHRVLRNYGCDGPSRKTKEYLEEKLTNFDALFAKIRRNDDKLNPFVNHDLPYWSERMFEKVNEAYRRVHDDILKRLSSTSKQATDADPIDDLNESLKQMEESINGMLNNDGNEIQDQPDGRADDNSSINEASKRDDNNATPSQLAPQQTNNSNGTTVLPNSSGTSNEFQT